MNDQADSGFGSLDQLMQRSMENKADELGFSGLEYDFQRLQETMLIDFERSNKHKHPGDKGNVREDLLYQFLVDNGYLPEKYGVSQSSARVISTTGHQSDQIDLLIYDRLNCPKLVSERRIQFYPIESVYGVIQVKSNLRSSSDVVEALKNLASFKKLRKSGANITHLSPWAAQSGPTSKGFGVLFAYQTSLQWETVAKAINEYQSDNPKNVWPNAVFILSEGMFFQTDAGYTKITSDEISSIEKSVLHGSPDKRGTLLQFYFLLLNLLNSTFLGVPDVTGYYDLPIPCGEHSYRFRFGHGQDMARCNEHDQEFAKRLTVEGIERILSVCSNVAPLKWTQLYECIYGIENYAFTEAQHSRADDVKLYNPDNIEISELGTSEAFRQMHDEIIIDGDFYWIPTYYMIKDNLIRSCPDCRPYSELYSDFQEEINKREEQEGAG